MLICWVKVEDFLGVGFGGVVVATSQRNDAKSVENACLIGIDFFGVLQHGDCLAEIFLIGINSGQINGGRSEIGIELGGLLVGIDGFVSFAKFFKGVAQVMPRLKKSVARNVDGFLIGWDGFVEQAGFVIGHAEIGIDATRKSAKGNIFFIKSDGVLPILIAQNGAHTESENCNE